MYEMTRTKYEAMQRHGYAGPLSDRSPELRDGWARLYPQATHWAMYASDRGTVLGPAVIVDEAEEG